MGVEEFQQSLDGHVCVCWMAEGAFEAEGVLRATSLALTAPVAGLFEVVDDALRGALGDVQAAAMSRRRAAGSRAMTISTRSTVTLHLTAPFAAATSAVTLVITCVVGGGNLHHGQARLGDVCVKDGFHARHDAIA
ncbi:hypothetical protein OOK28_41825 [Streptomyces sp. NBC_00687]|nr:hypothetical protein [Streptomyces sp. NBC_00687]MCX4920061.1 hypothetical protein [Streptomyces sp. NBC_00687]